MPKLAVQQINEDLKLIKESSPSATYFKPRYYNIGQINSGSYAGFALIVVIKDYPLISDPLISILATKDNRIYLTEDKLTKERYDETKVKVVDNLGSSHPKYIKLNDTFTLFREDLFTDFVNTENKDTDGSLIFQTQISGDLSGTRNLGKLGELDIYEFPASSHKLLSDEGGVTYIYYLGLSNKLNIPKTTLARSEIKVTNSVPLYNSYGVAVPADCSKNLHTKVVDNADKNKLIRFGTLGESDLYIYTDEQFYMNHDSYEVKIATQLFGNDVEFEKQNNRSRPNFEAYAKNNPIIYMYDYWGNLLALGEEEYKLLNKCQ